MLKAQIWNIDRTTLITYDDAEITSVGVIIKEDVGEPYEIEILIPFGSGRVEEVFADTPGALREEFVGPTP